MSACTARILSMDGGGTRGYGMNCFLQRFIQQWGIDQADLWKKFDLFAGTSVGGMMALAFAYGITPDQVASFFLTDSQWIFTIRTAGDVISGSNNASTPSNRPNTLQKIGILGNNDQFYRSVDPASNYGSAKLKEVLTAMFGTSTMQDLKANVLITSYQADTDTPILFSNLDYPEFSGQDETLVNVALATSAAPLYLPLLPLDAHQYIDGGIYINNPSGLAIPLVQMLKLTARNICLLSLGTGLGTVGFHETTGGIPSPPLPFEDTIRTLVKLIDAGITGSQEAVDKGLALRAQYTLDNFYRYRCQPLLDLSLNTELDNSDASYLTYLHDTYNQLYTDEIDKITTFIGRLSL